jgi:hypothetical protein
MSRFVVICFFSLICDAHDFKYPVAYCPKSNTLFIIHQQSQHSIELLTKNIKRDDVASKALSSFYIPVDLKVLPSEDGFSFIHNDMVHIKYFNKRSPKRIEFFWPLYGVNTIEWIDEKSFYFFAQEQHRFRIYQGTIHGDIKRIVSDDKKDALYPQKVDDYLFYIERENGYYRIIRTLYFLPCEKELVRTFENTEIAFLHMISAKEGFFLEYFSKINFDAKTILFWYHHLIVDKYGRWHSEPLFSFSIPTYYLTDSDDRLYESIIPFLPRYHHGCLYYVDSQSSLTLGVHIFCYEIITKKIEQFTSGNKISYFAPLFIDSQMYIGTITE